MLFCTCWGLPRCSLVLTPPFPSTGSSPTPGALSSLGDPRSLKGPQSTPLLLLPLTEMPQEFVLTLNLVPSPPPPEFVCLGIYIGLYMYFASFLPTCQDLVRSDNAMPAIPNTEDPQ